MSPLQDRVVGEIHPAGGAAPLHAERVPLFRTEPLRVLRDVAVDAEVVRTGLALADEETAGRHADPPEQLLGIRTIVECARAQADERCRSAGNAPAGRPIRERHTVE